MKNLLYTLLFFIPLISSAQMVVEDINANAALAAQNATAKAQLSKSVAQLTEMQKTYDVMKKASENVAVVSNAVKSMDDIKIYINNQKTILSTLKNVLPKVKDPYDLRMAQKILVSTQEAIKSITKLLENNYFKLNDKERSDMLTAEKMKIQSNLLRVKDMDLRYKTTKSY